MIDFYERLGVPFGTDGDALLSAISRLRQIDNAMANRAAAILLTPSRRKGYDRLWVALTRIGIARARAGLKDAPFGSRPEYSEFRFATRKHAAPQPSVDTDASGEMVSSPPWRKAVGYAASLALMALAIWAIFFDTRNSRRPPLQRPTDVPVTIVSAPPAVPVRKTSDQVAASQPEAPKLTIQPLPKTGAGKTLVATAKDNWIQIKTSGDHHTLVKVEQTSGQLVASRFIRASDSYRIYLPLGDYVLKTATGRQWFGDEARFGPDTVYSKPNDTFPLNKPGEYWEVELILQQHGNLTQRSISEAEFGAD